MGFVSYVLRLLRSLPAVPGIVFDFLGKVFASLIGKVSDFFADGYDLLMTSYPWHQGWLTEIFARVADFLKMRMLLRSYEKETEQIVNLSSGPLSGKVILRVTSVLTFPFWYIMFNVPTVPMLIVFGAIFVVIIRLALQHDARYYNAVSPGNLGFSGNSFQV